MRYPTSKRVTQRGRMKDRNPEHEPVSEPDPNDDYALRYGTQSFDALLSGEPNRSHRSPQNSAASHSAPQSASPFEGIDDYRPTQQPEQIPHRTARDTHDGVDDYAERHGSNNAGHSRYDGFDDYAQRHATGSYRRARLSLGAQVRGAIVMVLTIAIFIPAFKIIMAHLQSGMPRDLGMGGLVVLGMAAIGAIIVASVLGGILALFIIKK